MTEKRYIIKPQDDLFGDGDEFEVCDKGNNEAQMDNHSCKEWEEL